MKQKLLIVCLLLCCFRVYGQDKNSAGSFVLAKLKTFLTTHLTEKAYLQFDKPYYAQAIPFILKPMLLLANGTGYQP